MDAPPAGLVDGATYGAVVNGAKPEARGRGLAHVLVAHALREAAALGMHDVAGLTTTIPDLLPRWGFREVARDELPAPLAASPELQGACPASARVFVRAVTA